jgi:AHBA synthesis associated protein
VPAEYAIMIGDAPTDLASAQGAGVASAAALWAPPHDVDELLAAGPDAVLRRPVDLLALCPSLPVR